MEEDDDDFYGSIRPEAQQQEVAEDGGEADVKDEAMGVSDQEDEEEEDDDDVHFTLDKPADAKSEPTTA
ncbi:hypothetical protein LTR12_017739, partial [Friedmanniomyces endolithicus]